MQIESLLIGLNKLQKDSKELHEIRTILGNDDSISLVDQVQHLQDNTQPTNINNIRKELKRLQTIVADIGNSISYQYDEVTSAISSLESVSDECDELYDANTKIDELFEILEETEEEQLGELLLREQEETPEESEASDE